MTCSERARYDLRLWRIELSEHKDMPRDAAKVRYRNPTFLSNFINIHRKMWSANQGLTDSHPYESRPRNEGLTRSMATFEPWHQLLEGGHRHSRYLLARKPYSLDS